MPSDKSTKKAFMYMVGGPLHGVIYPLENEPPLAIKSPGTHLWTDVAYDMSKYNLVADLFVHQYERLSELPTQKGSFVYYYAGAVKHG